MKRILIAGIGNIFHGDDAFGVEVLRRLEPVELPPAVHAADFGIRCYDLAYAMAEGYDTVIFVDAATQGGKPGTIYLNELDPDKLSGLGPDEVATAGHSLTPAAVLQMARLFEFKPNRVYLVGCEPATLESEEGYMELSPEVASAIPQAVETICSLVNNLLEGGVEQNEKSGLAEAWR
jgi:hydrogenase maturation protease